MVQRTPLADSVPDQINDLRILSTTCSIHGDTTTAMEMSIGLVDRVNLVRVVQLALFMNLDFQDGS
jgi:hypothetical protein